MKRRIKIVLLIFIPLFVGGMAFLTNPSPTEYHQYMKQSAGEDKPTEFQVEHVNFYMFSAYTPIAYGEYGITHIGVFGRFFPISDGQFDYPVWLEPFH
ncbi:hypothetical protein [Bacillus sp. KH172YL63]|uniref:hypothetical protein n=1 Tax=Bacillus sp. KH172YL63 TaxID=2709784 RepID=UPI0013E42587|nr:hypothetical protein [Bacillus sp. KH172YL63]BCB02567.1 hypothetical protein KH172YL63_07000 [Bacillus sp. KH172YL63]